MYKGGSGGRRQRRMRRSLCVLHGLIGWPSPADTRCCCSHYELRLEQGDMYFVRTDPADRLAGGGGEGSCSGARDSRLQAGREAAQRFPRCRTCCMRRPAPHSTHSPTHSPAQGEDRDVLQPHLLPAASARCSRGKGGRQPGADGSSGNGHPEATCRRGARRHRRHHLSTQHICRRATFLTRPDLTPPCPIPLSGRRNIYQSIFLDDSQRRSWTVDAIDKVGRAAAAAAALLSGCAPCWARLLPTIICCTRRRPPHTPHITPHPTTLSPPPHQAKVLKTRMTRQFAHTWRHFATWVPFVSRKGREAAAVGRGSWLHPWMHVQHRHLHCQRRAARLPPTLSFPSVSRRPRRCRCCRGGAAHGLQVGGLVAVGGTRGKRKRGGVGWCRISLQLCSWPWWRQRHDARTTVNCLALTGSPPLAGAYTLFNTHEIATMSGLAVADRLGAPYPFPHDKLAAQQVGRVGQRLAHGSSRCWAPAPQQQRALQPRPPPACCSSLACDVLPALPCSSHCHLSSLRASPPLPLPQFDTYLRIAHGPFARRAKQPAAAAAAKAHVTLESSGAAATAADAKTD